MESLDPSVAEPLLLGVEGATVLPMAVALRVRLSPSLFSTAAELQLPASQVRSRILA